jgi:hypothetical protein
MRRRKFNVPTVVCFSEAGSLGTPALLSLLVQTLKKSLVCGSLSNWTRCHLECCRAARNMSGQLCAGNPPSFLEALTMPTITNARASIDYDWDGAPVRYHFFVKSVLHLE